jgi:hypothetical protein
VQDFRVVSWRNISRKLAVQRKLNFRSWGISEKQIPQVSAEWLESSQVHGHRYPQIATTVTPTSAPRTETKAGLVRATPAVLRSSRLSFILVLDEFLLEMNSQDAIWMCVKLGRSRGEVNR